MENSMKNYKKILSVVMTAAMAASLAACGNSTANTSSTTDAAASDAAQTSDAAATESGAGTSSDGKKYTIGICQQLEHPALDQATQGFEDALTELLGSGNVTFDLQNAQGEQANCATISNGFVANNYDLILANATTALQCAAAATSTIPVIGTSVTDYATALDIDNWTGSTGTNVSGTADLAPIDQQEDMLVDYSRMQKMSAFSTAPQNQTLHTRQPNLKKLSMKTVFPIKNIPYQIPTTSLLLYRVPSVNVMSSIFRLTIPWQAILNPSTILLFRQVFRSSPVRKVSVPAVV